MRASEVLLGLRRLLGSQPQEGDPDRQLIFHLPILGIAFIPIFSLVLNRSLTIVSHKGPSLPQRRNLSSHKDIPIPYDFRVCSSSGK